MPQTPSIPPSPEALAAARAAGLRYVNDRDPGLSRAGTGKRMRYRDRNGKAVQDSATLARIKRLAIPPAWTEVWICPHDNGHIQATGRDARGRKQYRYHADWRAVRDETKYERTLAFGRALPKIRRRVARDLARRGLGRDKVLAAMVRLLETTLVRVGNEEYARANGSVGLSTMLDRHARIRGGTIHLAFKGKSGQHHRIELHDPHLARIVRRTQDLPGQELFQYLDDEGRVQDVKSDDVNAYLREAAGREFSAKDFRTWAGTVLTATALAEFARFDSKAQAKKNVVAAIERVARKLGNTPAVCRKCYVHPIVLESYLDGATVALLRKKTGEMLGGELRTLSGSEGAVLAFLQERLRRPKPTLISALRQSVAQNRRAPRRHAPAGDGAATTRSRRRKSPPSPDRRRRG